jgi:acyl-CoA synthetase (AMP-forming)/AMP-acid ligase II
MIHNLDSLLSTFLQKKARTLNFLVFLMFDHIGGLNTLFNCLSIGSIITIPENRRPDHICFLIEKFKINILPSSPTFLNLMLIGKSFEKYDLSSLKMITYGTETMPESLLIKLKNELPSIKFIQTFGTSETGIATTSKSSESTLMKIEDPDQEYQIVDGELWLRSKTQILGYINHNNDSFTNDGWFKTGDLVEEFDGGYLKIVGRSKEVINVGGEKVLPTEIESVILELPEILDCKAKGVNNSITGQMVVVDVVAKKEYNTQEIKLLVRNHCRLRLDAYKVPAKIKIVDGLEFSDRFKKVRL